MRISRLELRDHLASLLQYPLGGFGSVACQFIGVYADGFRHIRRHQCKSPLTVDKGLLRGGLKPSRKIDNNLFPLGDASVLDDLNVLFHWVSLHTDVGKRPGSSSPDRRVS